MTTRREATPASVPAQRHGDVLDVSMLPSYGFGHRSLMWWGTAGMMAIEGVAFALMIVVYFYLRALSDEWPVGGQPPDLLWGTLNLALILVSAIPNVYTDRAAMDQDLTRVRMGLVACGIVGAALMALRWMEFTALNVRGDANAYGSVVWVMLGLHTFNLITDYIDTVVLTVLMFQDKVEGKRFVDVAENSGYWDFVVVTWIPIYLAIYWGARV